MLKPGAKTGSLAARLLSSAALVLVSGAYAAWQQAPQSPAPPGKSMVKFRVVAAATKPTVAAPASQGGGTKVTIIDAAPSGAAALQATPSVPAPAKTPDEAAPSTPPPQPDEAPPPQEAAASVPPAPDNVAPTPPASPPIQYALAAPPTTETRRFKYADGDFTGEPAECYWGTVQVEVQIKGGAIAEVDFLQMPNHRRRSAEISGWAADPLAQEAIREQVAEVDIVSSATNTTTAFQQSLKTALDKAQK